MTAPTRAATVRLRELHLKILAVALDDRAGHVGSMGAFDASSFDPLIKHGLLERLPGDLGWDRKTRLTKAGRRRIADEITRAQRHDPVLFLRLCDYRRMYAAWLVRRAERTASFKAVAA